MQTTLQQATTDPHLCPRLLDTHSQVWVSLLWGHCSFLLGPGVHKVLFVPSKSLFPQSNVSSSGSVMGLMVTFSKRAHAIPRSTAPTAPAVLVDTNSWLKLYTFIISQFLRVKNFHSISQGFNPGASWGWGLIWGSKSFLFHVDAGRIHFLVVVENDILLQGHREKLSLSLCFSSFRKSLHLPLKS